MIFVGATRPTGVTLGSSLPHATGATLGSLQHNAGPQPAWLAWQATLCWLGSTTASRAPAARTQTRTTVLCAFPALLATSTQSLHEQAARSEPRATMLLGLAAPPVSPAPPSTLVP